MKIYKVSCGGYDGESKAWYYKNKLSAVKQKHLLSKWRDAIESRMKRRSYSGEWSVAYKLTTELSSMLDCGFIHDINYTSINVITVQITKVNMGYLFLIFIVVFAISVIILIIKTGIQMWRNLS